VKSICKLAVQMALFAVLLVPAMQGSADAADITFVGNHR
jgi:hypothetical protein